MWINEENGTVEIPVEKFNNLLYTVVEHDEMCKECAVRRYQNGMNVCFFAGVCLTDSCRPYHLKEKYY